MIRPTFLILIYHILIFLDSVSISPTFFEQLLCQYSCAKKSTNLNCKYRKAARKTFVQRSRTYNVGEIDYFSIQAARKMLVKLTKMSLTNCFFAFLYFNDNENERINFRLHVKASENRVKEEQVLYWPGFMTTVC
jgi:hypothetical protein